VDYKGLMIGIPNIRTIGMRIRLELGRWWVFKPFTKEPEYARYIN